MSTQNPPDNQNSSNKSIQMKQVQYVGPLPPPAMLEQYNQVVPGAAERIIKMAEEQAFHRRALEKKALDTDSRNSFWGVVCAFVISVSAFALAAYAIHMGQSGVAMFIGGTSFLGLVGAFIYGTRSRRLEREGRYKQE